MNGKKIFLLILVMLASVSFYGCGKSDSASGHGKIIAVVNNYVMTEDDFTAEARSLTGTKEEMLDEIITKKLLIQEAQRQNFDKNKAFMKEIEKYWEQALLKLLYKKKLKELSSGITVTDKEAAQEYKRLLDEGDTEVATRDYAEVASQLKEDIRNRKLQAAFDAWITGLKKKANIVEYKNNLED